MTLTLACTGGWRVSGVWVADVKGRVDGDGDANSHVSSPKHLNFREGISAGDLDLSLFLDVEIIGGLKVVHRVSSSVLFEVDSVAVGASDVSK